MKIDLYFDRDGHVECIYDEKYAPLVFELFPGAIVARISHIEPCQFALRAVFHLLRWVFGDEGRVAQWTRTWRCLWRVNFRPIRGPIHSCNGDGDRFLSHTKAVEFELPYAHEFLKTGRIKDARP